MPKRFALYFLIAFIMPVAHSAGALTSPVGLSLLTIERDLYLEFPGPRDNVCGVRLSVIRSMNEEVCGLDLGLVWNVADHFSGIQIAGIINTNARARIFGLQLGGLFNTDGEGVIVGLQLALAGNWILSSATVAGLQLAIAWNEAYRADVYGAQIALLNRARKVVGLQIGLFNMVDELYGVQLGLININKAGTLKFFPVINVGI